MNTAYNPQAAADQARNTYRKVTSQLGLLGLDTAIPEGVRTLAEKSVSQTREAYDRSKGALDASISTFERSFDAAGQGATAFNRKIIDIAHRNLSSVFDLGQPLGKSQGPRRADRIAGSLLAEAVQRADLPSRGSPCAFDQGNGRCGGADQGACDEWHG